MISRRQFLKLASAGAIASAGVSLTMMQDTTGDIELVTRPVKLPRLPKEFEHYRIGFLTDVHLSVALPEEWVIESLELLHSSQIDLLALGGDYLWIPEASLTSKIYGQERNPKYSYSAGIKQASAIYQDFATCVSRYIPKDGAVAIYGNHDRWYSPKNCQLALGQNQIQLLVNEGRIVERDNSRLVIFGVDDYWTGFPTLKPLPPRTKNEARVILSHNPDFLSVVHRNNWSHFDLGLCGHTHGGQIQLPVIGAPFYNVNDTRLAEGLVPLKEKWVYTSRGLGMVEFPHRINCRPEVTVIELLRA